MVFLLVLEDYSRPEHIRTLGQLRMGKTRNVHFSGIRNIIVSASQKRKTSPWFCFSFSCTFLLYLLVSQIKMRLTSRSRASGTHLAIKLLNSSSSMISLGNRYLLYRLATFVVEATLSRTGCKQQAQIDRYDDPCPSDSSAPPGRCSLKQRSIPCWAQPSCLPSKQNLSIL